MAICHSIICPLTLLSLSFSNEQCNGSSLPSKRIQICIPVCLKHTLIPHLAVSAFGWVAMWVPRLRLDKCGASDVRKTKKGQEWEQRARVGALRFSFSPSVEAKCVYMPDNHVLECVLPPRISVRASAAPADSPGETENETEDDRAGRQATCTTRFSPHTVQRHISCFYCFDLKWWQGNIIKYCLVTGLSAVCGQWKKALMKLMQ